MNEPVVRKSTDCCVLLFDFGVGRPYGKHRIVRVFRRDAAKDLEQPAGTVDVVWLSPSLNCRPYVMCVFPSEGQHIHANIECVTFARACASIVCALGWLITL